LKLVIIVMKIILDSLLYLIDRFMEFSLCVRVGGDAVSSSSLSTSSHSFLLAANDYSFFAPHAALTGRVFIRFPPSFNSLDAHTRDSLTCDKSICSVPNPPVYLPRRPGSQRRSALEALRPPQLLSSVIMLATDIHCSPRIVPDSSQ